MSWLNRYSVFALLALLALPACGFEPIYAKRGGENIALPRVTVETVPGRFGQLLKNGLEDKLTPGSSTKLGEYHLNATLTTTSAAVDVAKDGTASRYNIAIRSTYVLMDMSSGKQIDQGALQRVASYNNVTNAFLSTYIAEQDAVQRGIAELVEDYRLRIAALAARGFKPAEQSQATSGT